METTTFLISGPMLLRPKRMKIPAASFAKPITKGFSAKRWVTSALSRTINRYRRRLGRSVDCISRRRPAAQGKLVRVLRGAVFDVAVDIRRGSPSYGKFISAILSAENWTQLWVPAGFAHGFCTLEPDSEVLYKVTSYYSRGHDLGLAWDDAALDIPWPIAPERAILSEKDRAFPALSDLPAYFS